MKTAKKGLLFDLDGTLLDTAPEFTYCLNTLLQKEGRPEITASLLRPFVSFGAKGMIEFGFSITEADPRFALLKKQFLFLYNQHLGFQTRYFPGITSMILNLKNKNVPWGIVTNKPYVYTQQLLEKFPLLAAAACVIAGDTLSTCKPSPDPLLHACQLMALSPKDCLYIGDAKTDVEASHNAGMPCAIAHYGYIPYDQDPFDWQAEHYFHEPCEIEKLLG